MHSLKRIAGTAAAALALAAGGIALAPAASAATPQSCGTQDGGILCGKRTTGLGYLSVQGSFLNQSSSTKHIAFTAFCTNSWQSLGWLSVGSKSVLPGQTASSTLYAQVPAGFTNYTCSVTLHDTDTGRTYNTARF
ncbi:hypothetical protein OG689_41330 [Kitasatospora sp. NBC_00240]|uniref:hypothetical protein n=1 Tax=Kitasatospora sp. NBC_00240 TaxID=2903567 RepID=UPI002258A2CC|nr:hypothetical protein [Kitasatospora sp. NBC_00240]MCX5215599.1 hypothetical protein [Kitasatospora sp. NBC_00240]